MDADCGFNKFLFFYALLLNRKIIFNVSIISNMAFVCSLLHRIRSTLDVSRFSMMSPIPRSHYSGNSSDRFYTTLWHSNASINYFPIQWKEMRMKKKKIRKPSTLLTARQQTNEINFAGRNSGTKSIPSKKIDGSENGTKQFGLFAEPANKFNEQIFYLHRTINGRIGWPRMCSKCV